MICPRCNKPTLDERERDGVTIDVCSECRGIWLDRGELERLVAMAARETERYAPSHDSRQDQGRHENHDKQHREHSYKDHHGHEHDHHRKKNWLAEIFD